jgi:outer membrane protein OmpA-like peptidoglycan-associated protein
VNGPNKYLSKWQKAEQKFVLANKSIENGNLERAKKLNIEATKDFNEIELLCIKDELLSEAKLKISLAKKEKADRYAQITLAQAQKFLDMADQELTIDRYNFDVVTNITNRSIERSAHAIFLSQLIQSTQDDLITTEELIIQWETDLEKIANSADIYPLMTDGYNSLTNSLVKYIDILRNEKQYLEQDQKDNLIQIADMKEEIRNLDERLGGATQERETLIQKIEAQARVKEQFDKVEKMFNSAEARVFRENNNVILRLIGLTFESNESKIIKESIPLLVKVEKAIDVYPRSEIIIEGHTDSQGDDQLNQKLSQLRADSIKQYMINAMRVKSYRIIATGFGETRPVANNETALGREKNRRIDIVLHSSQSNEIN